MNSSKSRENNRMRKTRGPFKKIGDIKGTFHARMDMIRTEMVVKTEEKAEEVNKRWQGYTQELYKKVFMTQITTIMWSLT